MSFSMPVELYMSSPVHTVHPDDNLEHVQKRLDELRISSLAVVDENDKMLGVISRTDLIRVGRRQAGSHGKAALLTLPNKAVSRRMTDRVVTVSPEDPISLAAKHIVDGRLHRIFVEKSEKLVGVLSTNDVMHAIRDKRVNKPVSDWMSSPVFTVRAQEPVSLATERLEKARIQGLVVVDEGWPVGVFTQREALEASDQPRNTSVDEVMNPAMLILEADTPLHRAAAQAEALRVRRVIVVTNRQIKGILTGVDFARATL